MCVYGQNSENFIRQTDQFIEKPGAEYYYVTKIFKLTWSFIANYAYSLLRISEAKPIKAF